MSSDSPASSSGSELERLQAAGIRVFRTERPEAPPVMFFIKPIVDWFEMRLIEIMRETFPEARSAFNPVFIHLPADGCRLTDLAAKAGMSKQAMSEVVEELIDFGYLVRFPDPGDRRAKIIVRTDAGLKLHGHALAAFGRIEKDLSDMLGATSMEELRNAALRAAEAIRDAD